MVLINTKNGMQGTGLLKYEKSNKKKDKPNPLTLVTNKEFYYRVALKYTQSGTVTTFDLSCGAGNVIFCTYYEVSFRKWGLPFL